jgi:hypothetical protein
MLIDLITIWKNGPLRQILDDNKNDSKEEKKPVVAQSSFHFDASPQVFFVKDLRTQSKAYRYGDLPTVPLQPEEQKIYEETLKQLSTNSGFYNGRQMLITGAIYDTTKNVLYLETVRVNYAFLVALEKMKQIKAVESVLHTKVFFKTGVMAPFISRDNKVTIIARKDKWQLRSVAAGFLECKNETDSLTDLIKNTALKEADEEFGVDRAGYRRLNYAGSPTVASISFRDVIGMGMTPTIEFIAPIQVKQDADYVLRIMDNNTASHAHEHIPDTARNIPLDYDERPAASSFMSQGLPGSFLYGPVAHACAQQVNSGMPVASRMAGIPHSRFYPIGIFKPVPGKALTDHLATQQPQFISEKKELAFKYKTFK